MPYSDTMNPVLWASGFCVPSYLRGIQIPQKLYSALLCLIEFHVLTIGKQHIYVTLVIYRLPMVSRRYQLNQLVKFGLAKYVQLALRILRWLVLCVFSCSRITLAGLHLR